MRYEGVVDMFQTVKMLRAQRPSMVQNEVGVGLSCHARYPLVAAFQLLVHCQGHSVVVCAVLHSVVLIHYPEIYYAIDHRRSGVVYNFEGVCSSVCLSVCMYVYQTITFESLDMHGQAIFAHPVYVQEIRVKFVYEGHRVRSRSREQKGRKSLFSQCKTLISNNSVSITHRAVKFTCSMGFSDMADRMS